MCRPPPPRVSRGAFGVPHATLVGFHFSTLAASPKPGYNRARPPWLTGLVGSTGGPHGLPPPPHHLTPYLEQTEIPRGQASGADDHVVAGSSGISPCGSAAVAVGPDPHPPSPQTPRPPPRPLRERGLRLSPACRPRGPLGKGGTHPASAEQLSAAISARCSPKRTRRGGGRRAPRRWRGGPAPAQGRFWGEGAGKPGSVGATLLQAHAWSPPCLSFPTCKGKGGNYAWGRGVTPPKMSGEEGAEQGVPPRFSQGSVASNVAPGGHPLVS